MFNNGSSSFFSEEQLRFLYRLQGLEIHFHHTVRDPFTIADPQRGPSLSELTNVLYRLDVIEIRRRARVQI